jgi:hypothetical protein
VYWVCELSRVLVRVDGTRVLVGRRCRDGDCGVDEGCQGEERGVVEGCEGVLVSKGGSRVVRVEASSMQRVV